MEIRPQPGKQEAFLASPADIVIFGGAAGGGKTYGLLLEPLRNVHNPAFTSLFFRRNATQITNPGGLWDESMKLYPLKGGDPVKSPYHQWTFPTGAAVQMRHLQYDADVLGFQGAQVPLILWDELTHFTKYQFLYMLSRNRSTCGVRPYMRATCNPDADSWVAEFIAWWIDPDTGEPIPERDGVLRYFTTVDDKQIWGSTAEECAVAAGVGVTEVKSLTFIGSKIHDNPILLEKDPQYLANLMALPRVERARLLGGNWKVRPAGGMYFTRSEVEMIYAVPRDVLKWVRAWDLAATEPSEVTPDPDWTAGVLMGRRRNGMFVVADCQSTRQRADKVRKLVKNTAITDGHRVRVRLSQDPGQAGKEQAASYIRMLAGYAARAKIESGDKFTRAEPFSAQWQAGNVQVVVGPWNDRYFGVLENFGCDGVHDDEVDASANAFNELQGPTSIYDQAGDDEEVEDEAEVS